MSSKGLKLRLDPNRCDRCGRCVRECGAGALKVGATYIYIDWRACDNCGACARACERAAIALSGGGAAASGGRGAQPPPGIFREMPKKRAKAAAAHQAPKAPPAAWTLLEAVAVLAIALAAFLGKDVLLASKAVLALKPSEHVLVRVAVLAAYYAMQFVGLALLARMRGAQLANALRLKATGAAGWAERLESAALAVGLALLALAIGMTYALVAQEVGFRPENMGVADLFGPNAVGFFLSVTMVALVAPFAEEVVFRGVLLGALSSRWGARTGIVVSALVFSAFHVSAWTFAPTLVLGLAAGWLAVKRRTLWPAISLHVIYNLTLVAIAYASAL